MPAPKSTHYVSLHNNGIYPAMAGGAEGYEDEHPTEWRRANQDEIERYVRGEVDVQVVPIALSAAVAPDIAPQPTAVVLAPEDPVVENPAPTIVAPAPAAPIAEAPLAGPSAPAPVVSATPVMPAPLTPPAPPAT